MDTSPPPLSPKRLALPMPGPGRRETDWRSGQKRGVFHSQPNQPEPTDEQARQHVSAVEGVSQSQGPADDAEGPDVSLGADLEQEWHQKPRETHEAYQAFWSYVKMGNQRSHARVAHRLGKSRRLIEKWSSQHQWRMRLCMYLEEEDRVRSQNHRDELADRAKRQGVFARIMANKILQRLQSMDVEDLTPRDMAHWYKISMEMERQALDADRLRRAENAPPSAARRRARAQAWARAHRNSELTEEDYDEI